MTERRHEARCKTCGFVFSAWHGGTDRDHAHGAHADLELRDGQGYVELECPRCGAKRRVTTFTARVMLIPKLRESA